MINPITLALIKKNGGNEGRLSALEAQMETIMAAAEQAIAQMVSLSERVTALESDGSGLPEVTAEDAGKILRVNSEGVWAAETIASAEEVEV